MSTRRPRPPYGCSGRVSSGTAAELSETEAALRQMRDDPPADRDARHRRAVQRVIDLTAATEREMARARTILEGLGKEGV